jgi:hypothetical protein
MATTTNYGWTTPDDTALVKDGASAIRTLGTSVDTTTKNLNPSTTLGDIEYRSSTANTNTRLGIGSSGQGLQVVAGVPSWAASSTSTLTTTGDLLYASAANTLARRAIGSTGNVLTVAGGVPTWAAPAGGAITYTAINSGGTALSGSSTVTISGLSGYNTIFMYYTGASTASANQFNVRLNADSGANYYSAGMWFGWGASNAVTGNGTNTSAGTSFIGGQTANAAGLAYGSYQITGANSTGVKPVIGWGTGQSTGGEMWTTNGHYAGTSVISSISLVSAANFDAGTIYVFGA